MVIGFTEGANTHIPDRSMVRHNTSKVLLASFGDGYEQRIPLGINSIIEEYSVTFKTRTKAQIDAIVTYFDTLKGVTNFTFTIPYNGGEKTMKVVCPDYNTGFEYDNFYSLEATFRRVYEA